MPRASAVPRRRCPPRSPAPSRAGSAGCKGRSGARAVEHRHDLVLDVQAAALELVLDLLGLGLHPGLDPVDRAVQLVVLVIEPREVIVARLELVNPVFLVGEIFREVVGSVAHRLLPPCRLGFATSTPPRLFSFHLSKGRTMTSDFHEVRFPLDVSLGSRGGPVRRTDIVTLASGREHRNSRWAGPGAATTR